MNIEKPIAELRQQIAIRAKQIAVLERLAVLVTEEVEPSVIPGFIDFDFPKTHEETVRLLQQIGARTWEKAVSESFHGGVDYTTKEFDPDVIVRIYASPPPPSCKIVETEEEIPAQPARTVKVRKLVCDETTSEYAKATLDGLRAMTQEERESFAREVSRGFHDALNDSGHSPLP